MILSETVQDYGQSSVPLMYVSELPCYRGQVKQITCQGQIQYMSLSVYLGLWFDLNQNFYTTVVFYGCLCEDSIKRAAVWEVFYFPQSRLLKTLKTTLATLRLYPSTAIKLQFTLISVQTHNMCKD